MQRRNLFKLGLGSLGLALSNSGFAQTQETTNAKTNTFDFVVVGAGAAGMAAAVEARSLGASVVVLEKAPRPDGNTFYASGRLCGVGSRYQKDTGDTLEKFVNDAWHETQGVGDKKVIEAFAKESGPSIDWLIDMGVPLTLKKGLPAPNLSRAFFMTTDGTTGGSILMRRLLKKAKDEGVKLLVNRVGFR